MKEIKHNLLSNNGISDKYEERKRAKHLSDSTRPMMNQMRSVRVDAKTTILVKREWSDEKVKNQIERVKTSFKY